MVKGKFHKSFSILLGFSSNCSVSLKPTPTTSVLPKSPYVSTHRHLSSMTLVCFNVSFLLLKLGYKPVICEDNDLPYSARFSENLLKSTTIELYRLELYGIFTSIS